MSTALVSVTNTLEETMTLGNILAQSGFFADSRQAAQAVVKVLAGRELGFGPIASMTGINIIKGKVALSANLMAAAIKRSGRYDYRVTEHSASVCTITFYELGKVAGVSTFSMDDAKQAGLLSGGESGNWQKYPKNMLFARALSNGAKWYCPDLSGGPLYTPDELGATIDGESGEVIQATNVHVVDVDTGELKDSPPPPPAANGNGKADPGSEPMSEVQRKALHAVGQDFYGAEWNNKRPELVTAATRGRSTSSTDLTNDEAAVLISALRKRVNARNAAEAAKANAAPIEQTDMLEEAAAANPQSAYSAGL